jgi:hypothetical protein
MNLGCGVIAVLLAFVIGAGALFVATPADDATDPQKGPVAEASSLP